ncbi:MAG: hypothetical protein WDA42_04285 [Candidatus Bathyarchaeia archaeon]
MLLPDKAIRRHDAQKQILTDQKTRFNLQEVGLRLLGLTVKLDIEHVTSNVRKPKTYDKIEVLHKAH